MARRRWTIELEDGEHTVEIAYRRVFWRGVRVYVDGAEMAPESVHGRRAARGYGFEHRFAVGPHACCILVRNSFTAYYRPDLVVDGRSATTGTAVMPWGLDGSPITGLVKRAHKAAEAESADDVKRLVTAVEERAARDTVAMQNHALRRLAELLPSMSTKIEGIIAQTCGRLLILGADPYLAIEPLLDCLAEALVPARRFAQPALGEESAHDPGDHAILNRQPEDEEALLAVQSMCRAVCAALSRSPQLRRIARAHETLVARLAIPEFTAILPAVELTARALNVLDGEEVLVLHPELQRGYRVGITGITHVWQLHTLLAAALIGDESAGSLPGTPPDPRAVAAARDGLVNEAVPTSVSWTLWSWESLQPDGALPQRLLGSIRESQPPASIPTFEGTRILLLGPPAVPLSGDARRALPLMQADLRVLETVPQDVAADWLRRLAEASPRAELVESTPAEKEELAERFLRAVFETGVLEELDEMLAVGEGAVPIAPVLGILDRVWSLREAFAGYACTVEYVAAVKDVVVAQTRLSVTQPGRQRAVASLRHLLQIANGRVVLWRMEDMADESPPGERAPALDEHLVPYAKDVPDSSGVEAADQVPEGGLTCPRCGSDRRLPVVYGELNPMLHSLAVQGKVAVGEVRDELGARHAPYWQCVSCGARWRGGLFAGGTGETIEDAVIIAGTTSTAVGIRAERQWLLERLGFDWQLELQELIEHDGRHFDLLTVKLADGTSRGFYFDVEGFFGKGEL